MRRKIKESRWVWRGFLAGAIGCVPVGWGGVPGSGWGDGRGVGGNGVWGADAVPEEQGRAEGGRGAGWPAWSGDSLPEGGAAPGGDAAEPALRGGQPARLGLRPPLTVPLVLSGNFGELRKNHFHTGIDLKTGGVEGLPVLAATDGVVSRVKVSPVGYGHALYLRSPHGITTVYAHLQRFEGPLARWVLEEQYRLERFDIDLVPPDHIRFRAGDTLGWSGNSGGSGGPHLHFEVRETATERPVNPLFWDLPIVDRRPPELGGLWLLPLEGGQAGGRSGPFRLGPEAGETTALGRLRLALEALDRLDGAENVCGIYRLELDVDGVRWFVAQFDTLNFAVNRDLNGHALPDATGRVAGQTHRLHRLPGNRLPIYRPTDFLGTPIEVAPGTTRVLTLRAWDVHGNRAERTVRLVGSIGVEPGSVTAAAAPGAEPGSVPAARFRFGTPLAHTGPGGARLEGSATAFYEDTRVPFYPKEDRVWVVGTPDLLTREALYVDVPWPADAASGTGWVAWLLDSRGKRKESMPCTFHLRSKQLSFRTTYCGTFRLVQDAAPPSIGPLWLANGRKDAPLRLPGGELRWAVSDALSEVVSVEATLDGAWLMVHWDPKADRAFYRLSDQRHRPVVPAEITLTARDQAGNTATWRGTVVLGE